MTHWTLGITPERGMVLHMDGRDYVIVPPECLHWHAERTLRAANQRDRMPLTPDALRVQQVSDNARWPCCGDAPVGLE